MSDLMLTAVLSMPYEMAMGDEFSRRQFWDRAQQALAEIERLRAVAQHEADCAEAYRAQVETMIRERDDRIDNNAGYSPGNCRWATATDQSRNTRRSTAKDAGLSFDGKLNKWVAYITVKRRTVRIGAFADRNDAIAARRQAEHHYWELGNEPPLKGSAPRNNRSGHVGVYQDKRHGTWTAYYGGRGRRVHIGSYRSAVEAAAARSEWLRAHGIGGSDAE